MLHLPKNTEIVVWHQPCGNGTLVRPMLLKKGQGGQGKRIIAYSMQYQREEAYKIVSLAHNNDKIWQRGAVSFPSQAHLSLNDLIKDGLKLQSAE